MAKNILWARERDDAGETDGWRDDGEMRTQVDANRAFASGKCGEETTKRRAGDEREKR